MLLLSEAGFSKTVTPARSLCNSDQKVVFSCPFKSGKTVSICASLDLSTSAGALQYKFGKVSKQPELVFPIDNKIPLKDLFWFYPNGYETSSSDALWMDPVRTLGFTRGGLVYELEITANKGTAEYSADLRVKKGMGPNSVLVTSLSCPLTRAVNHISDLQELGLPLQPRQ